MIAVVIAGVLFVSFWAFGRYARVMASREPDLAWKPTGVRYTFTGYDELQGQRGLAASLERQKAQRKAADERGQR